MKEKTKRIWKILGEELALFSAELMLVIVLGMVSLWGFIYLASLLITNKVQEFDERVLEWMDTIRTPAMDIFMKGFTALGNPQTVVIPILMIVGYFLFLKPHRWYAIKIPAVALGSYLLNRFLKYWFNRPRPSEEDRMVDVLYDLSFPSGHAMFALAFYGLLIHIVWKFTQNHTLRWWLTALIILTIFLIGISRVYLKVHYLTDVLAGFAAGFLWLVICLFLIRRIEKLIRRGEKTVESP
jgi:membrane-associated phospholipid phosphatase